MSVESPEKNLEFLAKPYPGRVVIVSLSEDAIYWRMFTGIGGRSDDSKNRYYKVFDDMNGHGYFVKTEVFDPKKVTRDPAATIYIAHRQRNDWHVASNGEQTEGISTPLAILDEIDNGYDEFGRAQNLYKNEGPNNDYTARITAALRSQEDYFYLGKIVRKPDNFEDSIYEQFTIMDAAAGVREGNDIFNIKPGEGYFIATYYGEGGEGKIGVQPDYHPPRKILLPGSLEENMDLLWSTYSPGTKAGLAGKEIEKGSGRFSYSFRSIHPVDSFAGVKG